VDADQTFENTEYTLEFYRQDSAADIPEPKNFRHRFHKKLESGNPSSYYYGLDNEFDFIQFRIDNPKVEALIIPKWKYYKPSTNGFTFAIDFGTTNTYIAYKTEKDPKVRPFDLNDAVATLFGEKSKVMATGVSDILLLLDREFVPRKIGADNGNIFSFPQRTAIAHHVGMHEDWWLDGLDVLLEGNIPFGYEKALQYGNDISTDLKWNPQGDPKTKAKMEAYLKQIVMLMQAKILLSNGSLDKSRLVWFYPSSMTPYDQNELLKNWGKNLNKYFFKREEDEKFIEKLVNEGKIYKLMESLAPFYAQERQENVYGGTVLSIDIGGGTTDIAMFVEGKLKATTSFKFAGNALFGGTDDSQSADQNGFVRRYVKDFERLLEKYTVAQVILDELMERGKASDINAFLFSVENSIEKWAKGSDAPPNKSAFSYTKKLVADGDLKFLILYFYVSLIWHMSKVLKHRDLKDIDVQFLMFSGTASKMLNILGNSDDLTKYTKGLFTALGLKSDALKVILVDNPKEVTCNGGLVAIDNKKLDDIAKIAAGEVAEKPIIYTGIKGKEFDVLKYSDYLSSLDSIKEELSAFHEFFFKLNENKSTNASQMFGVNKGITNMVQAYCKNEEWLNKHVKDSIMRNVDEVDTVDEAGANNNVTETAFFMPLKSIISELSSEIEKTGLK
jgi:hypothetical protein